MKTNKRKEIVRNSIKRIGLDCGNRAREIVLQIAIALGFKIHEDEFGVSAYGGNAIRISDHCTYMQTWVDNETWNAPLRLDVVIEDEPTEAVTQVRVGYDFTITEFVSQSSDIDTQKARTIAYDIRNAMNGNPYANNVRGEKRNLVATHGNNTQQINCNTNMNKNKIRLTESQLHNMISESVKRILSETRFGTPQPVFGNAINGKSAYLINDAGRMVAVIDNLKFVGNAIIGGNRATDEKVTFYLTGLFGHPVDGSTLPGTRKTKDGLYITHLQMDGGDEYYELLIDDYLLTPESAAEWDYYDPRNRRDIDDDDINRFLLLSGKT